MVEGTDTGWLAVLEKKGLHQAAGILENYGIDSETDVSLLDQGDLCNLVSQSPCARRMICQCGGMSRRVGSVMLVKFCSHSQVSKESLSASIHIGGTGLVTCLRRG